ncbi:hypothetical protein ACIQF6_06730 [Kitasatospora sp. NPDC092948]|uniref:hypothetical protein n=1 Tax=Kitasatospora sp. NPDC092948 TaxID=3364088 RepID=UPI0037F39DD1
MTDRLFIAYMAAFEAATRHVGNCPACRDNLPCKAGDPLHARFLRLQQVWTARSNVSGKHRRDSTP